MKKRVKIILMACFLCQSPAPLRAERGAEGSQFFDDNSGWKLFGGVVLAGLAVWAVLQMKNCFFGSDGKIFNIVIDSNNTVSPAKNTEKPVVVPEKELELEKPVLFKNNANDCYLNTLLTILFSSHDFKKFLHDHRRDVFGLFTDNKFADNAIQSYLKAELGLENRLPTMKERHAWNSLRRTTIKDKNREQNSGLVQKILLVELYILADRIARKAAPCNDPIKMCVSYLGNYGPREAADLAEAATYIFAALELIKPKSGRIPSFKELLGFNVKCTSKCPDCTAEQSEKTHPYIDLLGLPFSNKTNSVIGLDTLLKATKLDSCSMCQKKNCKLSKKLVKSGKRPPKLLFYMFARSYYDPKAQSTMRNGLKIAIPDSLTFTAHNKKANETEYKLYGIIQHEETSTSAHYKSLIRMNSQWYDCDDLLSAVKPVDQSAINKIIAPTANTKTGNALPIGVIYQKV